MSGGQSIVPRSIKGFNTFINKTCPYLVAGTPQNYVRFNWTAANLAAWQAFLTAWTPLFLQYDNRKESYTTAIKNKLLTIITNAVNYDRTNKLIMLIRACVSLNPDDCAVFGLPAKLAVGTSSTNSAASLAKTKTPDKTIMPDEKVYPKIIIAGGGILHFKAYTEKEQTGRPHKLKGFDELEYAIGVFYWGATGVPTHPTDTRMHIDHSTKANFKLDTSVFTSNLGALATGTTEPTKFAVIFFRWAKSKHPTLDGPWSVAFTTPIL